MGKLKELREEYSAKAAEMERVFKEAGENLDFNAVSCLGETKGSDAVAAWVKSRNVELSDIFHKIEGLDEYQKMRDDNASRVAQMNPSASMMFPGQQVATAQKSWSQKVMESDVVRGYESARKRSPVVELDAPDFMTSSKTLLTETGYAPQAVRTGLILPGALRKPVVADLLPQGTTDQIAIVYMEETTTTNAAAGTSEGAAKPESALAFTERSTSVRKIATVLPVTDELIADVPAMQSYLEARLRLFLLLAEDSAILTGDGNAPNIMGLLNVSGINTQAKGGDPTPDAIYKGMVKIETTSFLPPSGVIMHPLDWQDVRLLRTADGIYIWGSPSEQGPAMIWGLPVVTTTAITQNTALVGAFDTSTQMFRRTGVAFAISDQNEDFFIKNKLMLRVEERVAVVCYRPTGLCTVTGI